MSARGRNSTVVIVESSETCDDVLDPWAPGGSMSELTACSTVFGDRGDGAPRRTGSGAIRRGTAALVVALAVTAVLIGAIVIVAIDLAGQRRQVGAFGIRTDSAVGEITWARVEGDHTSLPQRIVDTVNGRIDVHGVDDAGRRWRGSTDGLRWELLPDGDDSRVVGGVSWRLRRQNEGGILYRVVAGGDIIVPADGPLTVAPPGWRVNVVPTGGPAAGFPVELAGETFVFARSPLSSQIATVVDIGRMTDAWLRWDGHRFESIAVPWPEDHRAEMVSLGSEVLALSADAGNRVVRLWRTADGLSWWEVPLPVDRGDATPVAIAGGQDEVTLSVSSDGRTTFWATDDGREFSALSRDPGMFKRVRGDFGFVAPDARSEPRLRVSADGQEWQTIDLSGPLGLESARRGTSVTVHAADDTIFVIASSGDERTLVVGRVESR